MSDRRRNVLRKSTLGEVFQSHSDPPMKLLPEYLFILSMLSQFKLPQVRTDFSKGLFILPDRSRSVSLEELDNFASLLLPSWCSHNRDSMKSELVNVQFEIDKLLAGSRKYLVLDSGFVAPLRTYGQWYSVLLDLGDSPYWKKSMASGVRPGVTDASSALAAPACVSKSVAVNTGLVQHQDKSSNTPKVSSVDVGVSPLPCEVKSKLDRCSQTDDLCDVSAPVLGVMTCSFQSCDAVSGRAEIPPPLPIERGTASPDSGMMHQGATRLACTWCGRVGHAEVDCWRRRGLCLICGGHHKMSDCPRYITLQKPKPKCSVCGGSHFGKHCRRLSRLSLFCQWCGRHGHGEDRCWVRSGACVICGSTSHAYLQCPKYVERTVPVFPPWC